MNARLGNSSNAASRKNQKNDTLGLQSQQVCVIILQVMGHYNHLTESEVKELNTYIDDMNNEYKKNEVKTYKFNRTQHTPTNLLGGIATGHEFFYKSSVEHEDDVSKIWHEIYCATSSKYCFIMDWSPYSRPSENDLEMWFALGCPDRNTIHDGKTVGALTSERLVEALGRDMLIAGF